MRRRGGHDQVVNLFSFQDIVCSVIGMVFFVVLIMALDIVETKATGVEAASQLATESEVQALRDRATALREEIAKTESDIERLTSRLNLASGDEEGTLDEVKRLEATLKNLYARIRQDQESLAKMDVEKQQAGKEHQQRLKEMERLSRRADELRAQLKAAQAAPRIAFIIDAHPDNLEPWLLEISDSRLRVASKDGRGTVLEFGGTTSEQRKMRFLAWVSSQSNQTHYFVLLTKPSGVRLSDEIEKELKTRGFDIGRDLLPEDWEPF
jgi:cell division protein FtsB